MGANQLEEFIGQVEQLIDLLPKQSFQFDGETISVEQWTGDLSEWIEGLRNQARDSYEVITVGDLIHQLSNRLMWLQDPITGEDLAKAHSLLKNIEELARIEDE